MSGTGRSVMVHQFSQVPHADIPRSSFDRSHGYKTTFDAGYLIPIFVDEVLPGDTFNLTANMFGRLATPLHPFMDNLFLDTFYFFVPLRLLWTNFPKMFGEQTNPGDSTSYIVPTITSPAGGYAEQSVFDYMGLPTKVPGLMHSAFWLRAYNLIYNQWFRDQNLQNSVTVNMGDGPDASTDYVLLRRGKRHDYFTSALPWPQKGPAVTIPLGQSAPIKTSSTNQVTGAQTELRWLGAASGGALGANVILNASATAGGTYGSAGAGGSTGLLYPSNLYADLGQATAATINQLRQSFQIQKIYERDARGGTRYTEIIQSHFGVTSPDGRLQRPEYLGGGSQPINVMPVAQTSNTPVSGTPQGNLAAMGTVHHSGSGFTKSFTEHGVLIGLCSARADLNYQNGLNRMWSRSTRWDFYWPALSSIGEQSVLNQEIFAVGSGTPGQDTGTWGYQERYAEYRYKPSTVTGKLRTNSTTPLDTWHLAQSFSSLPALNSSFIVENPPISRVIAVVTEPHFILDCYFQLKCARPMPLYGVPGLIDHF